MNPAHNIYLPDYYLWDNYPSIVSRDLKPSILFNSVEHPKKLVLYNILPSFLYNFSSANSQSQT